MIRSRMKELKTNCPGFIIPMLILLCAWKCDAQNINRSNKIGPMGIEVNTYTGNVFINRNDIYIPARQIDFDISFSYNSYDFEINNGYGNGWTFEYAIHYKTDSAGNVSIIHGDGNEYFFTKNETGFISPVGCFDSLFLYQPGKYLLRTPDGTRFFFDNSNHRRLTKINEPNGNFLNFSYSDSLVTSMTNAAGQTITLSYTNGKLASITDANTTPVQTFIYVYDNYGNLIKVTDPVGSTIKYTYLLNGPMNSTTDKNNNVADIIYNEDYSASELVTCNSRTSFSYDSTTRTTTVIDFVPTSQNQVTTYVYNDKGWLERLTGSCCGFDMTFTYDNYGNLIERKDANGNIYKYTYDNRGNYLTETDPENNVTSLTYSTDFSKVTSVVDPLGNIYTATYDAAGNLTQITRPGNLHSSYSYGSNGDLLSITDANNNTSSATYDVYGYPQKITLPLAVELNTGFDARANFITGKDGNGNIFSYQYDSLNRVVKIIDPLSHFHTFSYDKGGNLKSYIDPKGFEQTFNYDASNRAVSYKDAKGLTRSYSYDAMHNLISYTDALGKTTTFTYDKQNRVASITDAAGNGFQFSYDAAGNMVSGIAPGGETVSYNYDQLNRITSATDDTGPLGTITYDRNGNVTSFTNGSGVAILYAYDNLNRLARVTDPLGNSRILTYDNDDNMLASKDRNNHVSSYTYNALNRVTSYTDNNNNQVSVHYDSTGNVTSITDQNGNITGYLYDSLDRLTRTTYPDGSNIQFTYDANGNLASKKLNDGTSITYTYDTLNRIIAKDLPNGEHFTYSYDAEGRLLAATNASGTVDFMYDDIGRIVSETFNSHSNSYSYDVPGRKSTTTYPDGTVITKAYDKRARLISVAVNNQQIASYQYNNNDQLVQKDYSNGVSTSYQYDAANRLMSISTNKNKIPSLSFQYDNEMNRTVIERNNIPQASETFTYDAGNRLIGYKMGTLSGNDITSPLIQNSYTYDGVGNRVSASLNGLNTTYTANNLNQLTHLTNTSQNTGFTYDGNGNQSYDGNFYMRYDPEGRKLVDSSGSGVYRFKYDALGRRIQQSSNGVLLNYYYSGLQQTEERNASDSLLAEQVFANPFMPMMRNTSNQKYFYHQDHLGSTEAITDSIGRLKEWYKYEDFGKSYIFDSLNNGLASSSINNSILFTGQKYDAHNGSYNFHFRNYSPATGSFSQRDPIGYADQMGMYQYVGNNPGNLTDPLGLAPCPTAYENFKKKVGQTDILFDIADIFMESRMTGLWNRFNNTALTRHQWWDTHIDYHTWWNNIDAINAHNAAVDKKLGSTLNSIRNLEGKANFIEKGGKLLNGLDVVFKGEELISTISKDGFRSINTADATGKLVQSFLNFNPSIEATDLGNTLVGMGLNKLTGEDVGSLSDFYSNANKRSWENSAKRSEQDMYDRFKKMDEDGIPAYLPLGDGTYTKTTWIYKYLIAQARRKKRDERVSKRNVGNKNPCPPNDNPNGMQDLRFRKNTGKKFKTKKLKVKDPNAIIGPDGISNNKWVSVNDRLPYSILFANDTIATAPVKVAKIIYPVDPKQDAATFQLGDFGFNNLTFSVPQNANNYYQRIDLRDSLGIYVDVTAGLDGVNHQAFWIFESIDPTTLLSTADPLKGFLLTHDANDPSKGNGFVNFTIKPVSNANTGDTISPYAAIVFDSNDTIPTNRAWNTIDALPPVSSIADLPDFTNDTRIPLHYTGADDPGGSGVKWYSIYVSDNNSTPGLYASNFSGADTSFRGVADHVYKFYISATDSAGNIEGIKYADSVKITSGEMILCPGGSTTMDSKMNGASYQWQVDSGSGFTDISNSGVYSNADSSVLHINNAPSSMYGYQYRCKVNGALFSQAFLLKFENKWEGGANNAWENPANWSCGSLPDANTDVIINGGKTNYPQVNSNVTVRTVTTNPGSTVNVNTGFTLTIIK